MIDFTQTTIENLVVHHIGCRGEGEEARYSKDVLRLQSEEEMVDVLKQYFFKPFKTEAYFNFHNEEGLEHNLVYNLLVDVLRMPPPFTIIV